LNQWRARKTGEEKKGEKKQAKEKGRRKNKAPATVLNKN
jgi:hypothetical protein